MSRPARLGLAAALLLAPVAQAAQVEPPDEPPATQRPDAAHRPFARREPPNVFISPSGEPFHGAPGAAYAVADWFRRSDTDGDGRLTRAEFLADADRFFHRLDANGDGVIDGFEIQAYEADIAPEILPRIGSLHEGEGQDRALFHDRNGGVDTGQRRGGQAGRDILDEHPSGRLTASDKVFSGAGVYGVLNEPEPVQACDTNLDGRVSLAEWRAKAERRFTLLDAKGLGYLTLDGLPKTYVQQARDKAEREAAKRAQRP